MSAAARSDPHLMHPFGVGVGEESRRVAGDLLETSLHDDAQRFLRGGIFAEAPPCCACTGAPMSLAPRASAKPRSALLALPIVTGRSAASDCARRNSGSASPATISISISAIRAVRRPARITPSSSASSARVPFASVSGIAWRTKSVVNCGTSSFFRSALASTRCHGVVARCAASNDGCVSRRSYSLRECSPALVPGSGGPLTVCSQRTPSRRRRSTIAVAGEAQVGRVVVRADEAGLACAPGLRLRDRRVPREPRRGAGALQRARIEGKLQFDFGGHGSAASRGVKGFRRRRRPSRAACAPPRRGAPASAPSSPSRCTHR